MIEVRNNKECVNNNTKQAFLKTFNTQSCTKIK